MKNFSKIRQALIDSVIHTLGEMAFLDALPQDSEKDFHYDEVFSVRIDQPFEGRLMLFVSNELKKKTASAILGKDEEFLKESDINDSLLELLNVLTGDFLNRLYGKRKAYVFDFPTLLIDEKKHLNCPGVVFDGEGQLFRVTVCLEKELEK